MKPDVSNYMVIIERYLKKYLIENLQEFPAVAILGPRQCGKSTLAKMVLQGMKDVVYLDLEKPSDRLKISDPEIFFETNRNKLICLDEIQRLPEIFQVIRSEIDINRKAGRFLILGSASKDLVRQSSESLAGRIIYLNLTPFLFQEIYPEQSFQKYWLRGGFPSSFLATSDKASFTWRNSFIQTFLERDIPQLGFSIPAETIRRLWQMLAHQHGQLLNLSSLGNSLGLSHTTIRNYIDLLSETFMVRVLQPYNKNIKKRLVKTPRIYLRDHGILHSLLQLGSFDQLLGHPVFGSSWEGLVIENLIAVSPGWEYFFYRTSAGAEIDLVLKFGNKILAIECKATKSPQPTRGFWNALDDIQPSETWIVAPVEEGFPLKRNIWVLPPEQTIKKLEEMNSSFF